VLDGAVPAALAQRCTRGALWADLCRLAREELPPLVRLVIGDEAADVAA
jgi:hypothetical protein